MSKLTRAEKNAIIINEAKGVLHPDYYVCTSSSGTMQVRKRKTPLTSFAKQNENHSGSEPSSTSNADSTHEQIVAEEVPQKPASPTIEYDMITNKQLLERMLSILEKNTENKNQNLNDPEREIISNENKKFVENIEEKVIHQTQNNVEVHDKNIAEQLPKPFTPRKGTQRRIRILN